MPDENPTPDVEAPHGSEDTTGGWKPPASQADLDRIIQDRLARDRARFADYDDLREKAEQFDALAAASQTDLERSVSEAAEQARWVAEAELVPRLVNAEFRAAAAGRLDSEKLATILEPLDMAKFLTDDGDVDSAKVAAFIDGIAPAQQHRAFGPSSSGLGNRGSEVRMTPKEQAAAQIAKRFPSAASR